MPGDACSPLCRLHPALYRVRMLQGITMKRNPGGLFHLAVRSSTMVIDLRQVGDAAAGLTLRDTSRPRPCQSFFVPV